MLWWLACCWGGICSGRLAGSTGTRRNTYQCVYYVVEDSTFLLGCLPFRSFQLLWATDLWGRQLCSVVVSISSKEHPSLVMGDFNASTKIDGMDTRALSAFLDLALETIVLWYSWTLPKAMAFYCWLLVPTFWAVSLDLVFQFWPCDERNWPGTF